MRRLVIPTFIVTSMALASLTVMGTTEVALAAPTFALVHGSPDDGRLLADVSDDGRYVLSRGLAAGSAVVDRITGTVHQMPDFVSDTRHISGNGRVLSFSTTQALSPADADTDLDAYTYDWQSGTTRLLSAGTRPGDAVNVQAGPLNVDGTSVGVTVTDGAFASVTPMITNGTTMTELASSLGRGPGSVHGISSSGRYAVVTKESGCPDPMSCTTRAIFRIDLQSNTVSPVGRRADGTTIVPGYAVELSADGTCVAFVDQSNAVWRDCGFASGTPEQLSDRSTYTAALSNLSISPDGATVAWIDLAMTLPRPPMTSPLQAPHVFMRTNGGPTVVVDALPGQLPYGEAVGVEVIRPDLVFMQVFGTGVIDGPDAHRIISYAEDSTSPPTTVLPTTAPPTTAPPTTSTPAVGSAGPTGAGVFTGRTPVRILDTRTGLGAAAGLPARGTSIVIPLRGRHGVPADATAVAVQLTATEGTGAGFVSLIPSGTRVGVSSNLNLDVDGETIANSAIVPIGADGSITLYTNAASHAIVDLAGWWTPSPSAASAGRFQPVGPVRMLDTRPDSRVGHAGPKPAAGSITDVQVTGRLGVPTTGVSAVVLNVTIAEPESLGFVQAAPAATLQPGASSTVNVGRPGQVIAASTIVPVDAQGRIALYSQPSTHLIVDVAGWFTDASVAPGNDGMFVPITSGQNPRQLDTRPGSGLWNGPKPTAGQRFGMPSTGQAIVGNVTVVDTDGAGFVQLGPAATMTNGATSNINPTTAGETVANAFIVPVGGPGIGVFTSVGTHVIIDVSGYMTS